MILNIKDFREVCKTISGAVDDTAANLGLVARDNKLFLSVTNREYFVSIKYDLDTTENFKAVVDASLFLNLISGITTDSIELIVEDNVVKIKSGKSSYKLPMIYENDHLMELPVISVSNKTIEMPISNTVLQSIVNINGKELLKLKSMSKVNELQKLYYITNEGCFTFTNSSTLNAFTLEKPVKMLLNDRVVKLFKLFKDDVRFSLGHDTTDGGQIQTKVVFENESMYLAAVITNDDLLLSKIQGPCDATKNYINSVYKNKLVLSANQLAAAISRIMLFTKNSISGINMNFVPATFKISTTDLTIEDSQGNIESITVENGSVVGEDYDMTLNLSDIKLALDSCKDEHITLNCGNKTSIVITRNNVSNLIPECVRAE